MSLFDKFRQRLTNAINCYATDLHTKRLIDHNKKLWSAKKCGGPNGPEVLFEFNPFHSALIAYSYLANVLAEKYGARIVAYGFMDPVRWVAHAVLPSNAKKTYQSFNATAFVNAAVSARQAKEARAMSGAAYERLKSTRDVEDLEVDGVWIGDLVYDSCLKFWRVPTIDLKSPKFMASLKQSLEYFVFWRDYLDTHDVKAINVSHCVYHIAIPLRIAVKRGIPVYQVNATHLYRLKEDYLFAYNDFLFFPEKFRTLARDVQEDGLREAEARIKRRFSGEIGVDMPYSKKSAYGGIQDKPLLRKSDRRKILIAAHCFFDSPHSYGKNLFPDFHEWLVFLGRISERTDYDWYIKTHSDYIPETRDLVESFTRQFPKFTLLPPETSHHQLISEGIDVALTVYGTIGFEYAALGITVINASVNNPHAAYHFNIHPRSVEEYESILMNLDRHKAPIDKAEVYEYYFMRFLYNTEDWLFDDYSEMEKELGCYREQFTPRVYEFFLKEYSTPKHERIVESLRTFVDSGDFRLHSQHIPKGSAQ